MERLSKESLLTPKKTQYEEEFTVQYPGYDGTVKIRPIKSVHEFQAIIQEADKIFQVSKTMGIDLGRGLRVAPDRANIVCATIVACCMVDPDMDVMEVLQFQENTGMIVSTMADRIALISGLASGKETQDKMEEDMRADSFLSDDLRSKFRIPASSSLGSESDASGVDGNSDV